MSILGQRCPCHARCVRRTRSNLFPPARSNGLTINSTDLPLTNLTGVFPGPANTNMWTPVLAPNVSAVGAGGGSVFVVSFPRLRCSQSDQYFLRLTASHPQANGTNASLTSYVPQNLTAMGLKNPATVDPVSLDNLFCSR